MKERSRRAFLAACGLTATAGCSTTTSGTDATANGTGATTVTDPTERSPTATTTQESIDLGDDPVWPTFGGSPGNTGRRGDGDGPSDPVESAWITNVDGIYTMPEPVLAANSVFIGSGKSAYAMDALTGEPRWNAKMGSLTHNFSPSVAGESVLFGAQSNIVSGGEVGGLASFEFDGGLRWERALAITTSPSAVGDTVYLGESTESGAQLRALATGDGADRWMRSLDAAKLRGTPAVADGVVFATASAAQGDSGIVVARDAADGSEVWTTPVDAGVRAAPAVQDGTVYVQADDGRLLTFDAETGEMGWTTRLGDAGASAPALTENRLIGLVKNSLVGIDLATGDRAWETDIGYTLINGVSIAGGRAYVGGSRMTAVDVASGDTAWEQPVPGQGGGFGAPVVVGNTAFVGVCIKDEAGDPYDDFLYAYV